MQKLLPRSSNFIISLLSILITFSSVMVCVAQISITESSPIDVRFSLNQTTVNNSGVILSLPDLLEMHAAQNRSTQNPLISYRSEFDGDPFYYVSDESRFIYPGRIQSGDTDDATFFTISITNDSNRAISSMLVAFDFVYKLSELNANYHLNLNYRVNQGNWRSVSGGAFSTSTLNDLGGEWDTFSMQMNLTDIFLRSRDHLDLRWEFQGLKKDDIEPLIPLALQRMEINPEHPRFNSIQRGALVITEILPSVSVDGMMFEYIELFNSTEKRVSLKGLELHTSDGVVVIQRNIDVEPYRTVVFSTVDLSGLESVGTTYMYSESILSSRSGRIEIQRGGEVLSRAAFESHEAGVALELDRVANAISGYTSLQNLRPSENNLTQGLKGSPGVLSGTIPLYSRTLENSGWYFISPPGHFPERLNRHTSLEFFDLNGNSLTVSQLRPFMPVAIYKSDNRPVTLYVEHVAGRSASESKIELFNEKREFRVASMKDPHAVELWSVSVDGDQKMAPMVTVWDESLQRFRMLFTENGLINKWKPFLINSDLRSALDLDRNRYQAQSLELNRYIPISVYEGSGSDRVRRDEAMIGFIEQLSSNSSMKYDLPKINGTFQRELALPHHGLLYLTSPESKYRANSFVHLPYMFNQPRTIGLGFEARPGSSGPVTLEWILRNDIPDDWNMKLEDTQTGIVVDMREVNHYRFRVNSQAAEAEDNPAVTGLSMFEPSERNRFVITIETEEQLVAVEEVEERPGSIELRQNYPNPFNPATNITFFLPEERTVRVGVYNIVGQQVSLLIDDTLQAGEHSVVWDAANNPSGIYIVQLETGSRILTRKITLIK